MSLAAPGMRRAGREREVEVLAKAATPALNRPGFFNSV